ncbi:MAG: 3-deoxy-7-phosphoheptulonate synthase [Bacillota bacterium]
MIIVMRHDATQAEMDAVKERLERKGFSIHLSQGVARTVIGAIGDKTRIAEQSLEAMPGVDKVVPILQPYKLAGREFKPDDTVVEVGSLSVGGEEIHVIAGPCAVENRDQLLETAEIVRAAGATMLRGGAYKPRSSPYSFQGLEEEGLKILAEARERTGLAIVTEVMDPRTVEIVSEYADVLQVGARNMQNFNLLKELGKADKPVLLKRGPSSTIEEWILAAEYIMSGGNHRVIFCERGIRTFENYTRNTLDLSAVPALKKLTHLPVIVDPSHGTGKRELINPMSKAALIAGADGLMIEVHPRPSEAMSDGPQSLDERSFNDLMDDLRKIVGVVGRRLGGVQQ